MFSSQLAAEVEGGYVVPGVVTPEGTSSMHQGNVAGKKIQEALETNQSFLGGGR